MTNIEKVYKWDEVHINPYLKKIDIMMLCDDGLIVTMKTHLKGEGVKNTEAQYRKVRFDYTFIEAYLERKVLQPLRCANIDELKKRMIKAKEVYQEEKCL